MFNGSRAQIHTGLSRASFSCLSLGQRGVSWLAMAHVQSSLRCIFHTKLTMLWTNINPTPTYIPLQGVVTYIPAVLTPTTRIKARSSGQAIKLKMIKRSRCLFCTAQSRSRWVLSFDSTHTQLTIKGQGSFSGAIKWSRSKNGPDQILIPDAGVSTAGIYVTTPCVAHQPCFINYL